jgi:hypothetical protein
MYRGRGGKLNRRHSHGGSEGDRNRRWRRFLLFNNAIFFSDEIVDSGVENFVTSCANVLDFVIKRDGAAENCVT